MMREISIATAAPNATLQQFFKDARLLPAPHEQNQYSIQRWESGQKQLIRATRGSAVSTVFVLWQVATCCVAVAASKVKITVVMYLG
jgi:hypothetical protein